MLHANTMETHFDSFNFHLMYGFCLSALEKSRWIGEMASYMEHSVQYSYHECRNNKLMLSIQINLDLLIWCRGSFSIIICDNVQ